MSDTNFSKDDKGNAAKRSAKNTFKRYFANKTGSVLPKLKWRTDWFYVTYNQSTAESSEDIAVVHIMNTEQKRANVV